MTSIPVIPDTEPEISDAQAFRQHMGKVSRHSSVFFAGTVFSAVTAYAFKVYLARRLGAEALGIYALGMTIVGVTSIFNALGLPQAALRFVAAYSATGKLDLLRGFLVRGTAVLVAANVLLAAAMLVVGPWVAVRFYHAPELNAYMGLFVLIMLLGVLTTFFGNVMGGYKDVARRTVINNFVGNPLMMIATIILIVMGLGLRGFLIAQVASAALVVVLMITIVWKLSPREVRSFAGGVAHYETETISFCKVALGMTFLGFLMTHADRVVIGHYLEPRDLGIYAMAAAVVTFVPVVLSSVNQIFAPTISDLHSRGQHDLLARMFQTLTKWILGLTLPLAAVIIIFSAPVMGIFGKDFEVGWPILIIGTIGQLVNCGVGPSGMMVLMSGHQRTLIKVQAVMAVLNLTLSVAMVPLWGIVGAALSSAITTVIANLAYVGAARRTLGVLPYNRSYLRLLLPAAGMLTALCFFKTAVPPSLLPVWLAVGLALVLSYLVFIGIALAFGLDADDQVVVRAAWARVRGTFQWAGGNG